jgi:hypothetical protein
VRSAIYIVETDGMKEPPEYLLGSRLVSSGKSLYKAVKPDSVLEINGEHDGHVNRNIRIALAMIDLSQPHIEIVNITSFNESMSQVTWRVNGCHTIDEARVRYFLPNSPQDEETIHFIKIGDHKYT